MSNTPIIICLLVLILAVIYVQYEIMGVTTRLTTEENKSIPQSMTPQTTKATGTSSNLVNVSGTPTITTTLTPISKTYNLATYCFTVTPTKGAVLTSVSTSLNVTKTAEIIQLGSIGNTTTGTLEINNLRPMPNIQGNMLNLQFMANDTSPHVVYVNLLQAI